MKSLLIGAAALTLTAVAAPAQAAETLVATFTQPDGGQTTQTYSGIVRVLVTGTGQSNGTRFNDAFYDVLTGTRDGSFYQLTFGTTTLVPLNPAQNAVNFLVGPLPAFSPTNTYQFLLNTGTSTPSILHFGVGDGQFADNSGAYTITVTAVPEPATWATMILGVGTAGAAMRRRRSRRLATA